ncbi:peptidoglycan D,D-transpeptidase FtsI family protein [Thermostichus vulcanus]|uniref:peptidoglycan D,D-transpeptidase FtsI family protein n=1 Tax=Thermostichus vulcanus TaxID=32053 RepID=UPI001FCB26AF|nr:penicillin-binding protein 2 [Thermostichus vulcanus]
MKRASRLRQPALSPGQRSLSENAGPVRIPRRRRAEPGQYLPERLGLWLRWILGNRIPTVRQLDFRTWMTGLVLVIALFLTGVRLVYLQHQQAPMLQERAQAQQRAQLRPFIPRRSILDRHSIAKQQAELLAVDRPVYTLWAHPRLFGKRTPQEIAAALAPLLRRPVEQLTEQLTSNRAVRVERWISQEVADQIQALFLDGLELVSERQRIYPQKEMAAEVVGYVDLDHQGQAGLEYSQQGLMERTVQPVTIPRDGYGQLLAAEVPEGLLQSRETVLQLTLDMRLQRAARAALKTQLQRFQALRGTVIILQPQTGEILALVSEPTYDPNRYFEFDPGLFRNWAVTDLYEPGSTFKPINIAIGLDAGAFSADERVYDEGRILIGQWPIQNYDYNQRGAHGWMSVTDILRQSSNVGMVHLMRKLDPRQYYNALVRLGLNERSGVDLPFEPASRLKPLRQFLTVPVERATTAFGQGFALTPLQLASLHCIIANGGLKVQPHVVRGLVEKDTDTLVWGSAQPQPVRVLSEQATLSVRTQMRDVVDFGTGQSAKIEGYEIGGKTGTAQKAGPRGGYLPGKRITSFVGYFPAIRPNYVILAVIDEPRGEDAFGSTTAAPIVRSVIQEIITLEGIRPNAT